MDTKIAAQAIWDDLDAYLERARKLHHEDYDLFRDFWIGGDRALAHIRKHQKETIDHWQLRRRRLVGANYTKPIINTIARAEYGGDVVRKLSDEALARQWAAVAGANRVGTFQLRTARQRAIDGTCIVQLYWDSRARAVRWQHVLPEHFFPVVLPGDNYDDVAAVIIDRQMSPVATHRIQAARTEADRDPTQRRVEIYTPDEVAVWVDGARLEDGDLRYWERPARYGCLPFVLFNGQTLVGDLFGYSTERGLVELNHFINRHLSNLSEIIDYQAFSLLVIQGGLDGLPTDEDGRVSINLGMDRALFAGRDGDAHYADANPKIEEIVATIDRLVAMMYETGSVPIAAVQPQQSHAESGVARRIQFLPLRDLVGELQTQDREAERELMAKTLLIDGVHRGEGRTFEQMQAAVADATIQYPANYLPEDQAVEVEVFLRRREAGLECRRQRLRAEHPNLDEAGIDDLIREIDDGRQPEAAGQA